jgi:hypothetical protein
MLIKRNHQGASASVPEDGNWEFAIGINLQSNSSASPQAIYTRLEYSAGNFGTYADPNANGPDYPALNATDRYPVVDFGYKLPSIVGTGSPQVLHCKLLGQASSITISPATWTISNVTVVDTNDTTFDINVIAAGGTATLSFLNTKRMNTDVAPTGCRGLTIRAPGIALADTTHFLPHMTDAMAPFEWFRWVYPQQILGNTYTREVADMATPTTRPTMPPTFQGSLKQTIPVETCLEMCNELGKNAWIHIPIAASDALITEMATIVKNTLDPAKWCMFELGNENWNSIFLNMPWCHSQALEEVNGFVYQYCESHWVAYMTRTANIVTAEFQLPAGHGCAPGDVVYTNSLLPGSNGYKTILTTPDAITATWSDPGADFARQVVDGQFRSNSLITSCVRAGTTMTLTFGRDHGMTGGVSQIRTIGITGLSSSLTTITTAPDARTITVPCTAGLDGPIVLTGASSLCVFPAVSELNSADNLQDQHTLRRRWCARRTKEISELVQAVFGVDFDARVRIGLFDQPGTTGGMEDAMIFLDTTFGPPSDYIQVIGLASYAQLNATGGGGPNLRDVDTYNGNTPPLITDYADCWQTAASVINSNGPNGGKHDTIAMTARLYNMDLWQYEYGPDATTTFASGNGGATATKLQKIDTLHDPLYDASYRTLINVIQTSGFKKATIYNSQAVPTGTANCFQSWGIFRDYTTPTASVRFNAVVDALAAPAVGPTRNLLSITDPVTIDGRAILNIHNYSGAYPSVCVGSSPPMQNWIITAPEDGDWSFEPTFNCTSGTKNIIVQVNGVSLSPNYSIPLGTNLQAARTISLTKGHNVIRTLQGTSNPGTAVTAISYLFTPVP